MPTAGWFDTDTTTWFPGVFRRLLHAVRHARRMRVGQADLWVATCGSVTIAAVACP